MSDFTVHAGDDHIQPIDVVDGAGAPLVLNGENTELTWHLARWSGGTPLVTKTQTAGITVPAEQNTRAVIRINAADTAGLYPGEYYHILKVRIGGVLRSVRDGPVTIEATPVTG